MDMSIEATFFISSISIILKQLITSTGVSGIIGSYLIGSYFVAEHWNSMSFPVFLINQFQILLRNLSLYIRAMMWSQMHSFLNISIVIFENIYIFISKVVRLDEMVFRIDLHNRPTQLYKISFYWVM